MKYWHDWAVRDVSRNSSVTKMGTPSNGDILWKINFKTQIVMWVWLNYYLITIDLENISLDVCLKLSNQKCVVDAYQPDQFQFDILPKKKTFLMRFLHRWKLIATKGSSTFFKPWREKCARSRRWWKKIFDFRVSRGFYSEIMNEWNAVKNIFCMHHKLQKKMKRKTENHAVKMKKKRKFL